MNVRAFEGKYEFYILQKDIPCLSKGAVFYLDKKDRVGNLRNDCLRLCWTPTGGCYGNNNNLGIYGDTVVFPASAREEIEWFVLYNKNNNLTIDVNINLTGKEDVEKAIQELQNQLNKLGVNLSINEVIN